MRETKLAAIYRSGRHPRVLWDTGDLPTLRAKAAAPALQPLLAAVLARCATYVDPTHAAYLDPAADRPTIIGPGAGGGTLWPKLSDLIVATLVTDDPRWPDTLAAVLAIVARGEPPAVASIQHSTMAQEPYVAPERLLVAAQCGLLPLAYDAVHDRLAPTARAAIAGYLRSRVVEPYTTYLLDSGKVRQLSLGMNIFWWDFSSWLWSLAAVCDPQSARDRQALAAAAELIRRGLHLGVDAGGYIGEGPFYGSIEQHAWVVGAEVLRRAGVGDLWADEPLLDAMVRTQAYHVLPGRAEMLNRSDAPRASNAYDAQVAWLLHARRSGNVVMQTLWQQLAPNGMAGAGFPSPLGPLGQWLWFDPAQRPRTPGQARWPLARPGGVYGMHLLRSGWSADDLVFSLSAAGRHPGTFIHQHVDAGNFCLYALGETFAGERGYGCTKARYHTVLAPGGAEPPDAPEKVGQMWRGGHTYALAVGQHCDYVAADLAWQWTGCWHYRHALVLRAPGAEPYVVLLDHCNQNNDWGHYDWQMQLEPDHRAEFPAPAAAVVHGRQHRLELAFAHPRAADYPKPHALELLTDTIASPYATGQGHDDVPGTMPRLIARLHGYNGLLLAALMPRRAGTPQVGVQRVTGRHQFGLVLDHGAVVDTIVAAPIDRGLDVGGLTGEATLAWVRRDRRGRLVHAAAVEAFALAAGRRTLLPRQGKPATLWELPAP